VYFFSAKAFLISAIITAKIVYLGFLASRASGVALIMQISRVLSLLKLSIVSYIVSCLALGLVLGTKSVLDLGSGSLSILFIVVLCLALPIRHVWAGELIRHSNQQSPQSRDTATFLEVCIARWVGAWA